MQESHHKVKIIKKAPVTFDCGESKWIWMTRGGNFQKDSLMDEELSVDAEKTLLRQNMKRFAYMFSFHLGRYIHGACFLLLWLEECSFNGTFSFSRGRSKKRRPFPSRPGGLHGTILIVHCAWEMFNEGKEEHLQRLCAFEGFPSFEE